MRRMKRKRITAALAKVAREIHDSEEFLEHIGNIADRYKREYALERGPRGRDVRRALKAFRKHSTALAEWLRTAQTKTNSLEYEALAKVGAAMHSAPNQMLASSASILTWLQQAEEAAGAAEGLLANKKESNAARIAAEALKATFERHGVKWSTQVSKQSASSAVRLLCALAKGAGQEMSAEQAREILIAATRPQ
jgi:hypothetical protein